jgi:hypothetical protein
LHAGRFLSVAPNTTSPAIAWAGEHRIAIFEAPGEDAARKIMRRIR